MKLNKHEEAAWDQYFAAVLTVDYAEFKDREIDLAALSASEKKELMAELVEASATLADQMVAARRERL